MFFSFCFFFFSKFFNFQRVLGSVSVTFVVKYFLMISLLVSFFLHFINFWFYIHHVNVLSNFLLYNFIDEVDFDQSLFDFIGFQIFGFNFSIEMFGFIFILLAYLVGIISFLSLDSQFFEKNFKYVFVCNMLVLIIYLFTICSDFLMFFVLYECLLIPSFLFVYHTSQYKKGIQASLYFLIWTQLGSFLVLAAIAYIVNTVGGTSFFILKNFVFTSTEAFFLYFLIFFGFGFKIPIWPFHFWLTKTHVEAPAGFSIFLSGFLVKSAVYGFYRLSNILGTDINTVFFTIFPILGVIDSSFKMWAQLDLKKLVAYCTVQEMSLLYLTFIWGDTNCFIGGVLLCITHALLSSLMFFLVDCIQRRYKTRLVTELSGILHRTPNLGISLILMVILYSGLPGSLKFTSEFYIYSGLLESLPVSSIIMLFSSNFFGIIGFSKCWYNVIFGLSMKNQQNIGVDLTFKELLIIVVCLLSSFLFNFNLNVLFN
jgi:NADH-quinone oxidoreductase subunit M